MAKLVDAGDLKSSILFECAGSSPAPGIKGNPYGFPFFYTLLPDVNMNLDLSSLNPCQLEATTHLNHDHCLILAGAGSGKTRVLTYRIAWLVQNCNVDPHKILAFTFTNKAALEMKTRTELLIGDQSGVRLLTFHKFGLLFLKKYAQRVGLLPNFSIFDTSQQEALVKKIFDDLNLKQELAHKDYWTPKKLSKRIAFYKDTGKSAQNILDESKLPDHSQNRPDYVVLAKLYDLYNNELRNNNAIDFADMLKLTYRVLNECDDIRESFRNHYQHILVDEFQDTNLFQIQILKLLTGPQTHLTAVGDDDQSIYGWRGADNTAILRFEKMFGPCTVYKLEQNYRSTKPILACASALISHNLDRNEKTLWTSTDGGEPVHCFKAGTMKNEADRVVQKIKRLKIQNNLKWQDFAVLFRVNSRSSLFEQACAHLGVPYVIVGGTGFYEREEISDLLAYLRLLVNPLDRVSLIRIINKPARNIGEKSVQKLLSLLEEKEKFGIPREDCLHALLKDIVDKNCVVPRGGSKFVEGCKKFLDLLERVTDWKTTPPRLTMETIIHQTNYLDFLKKNVEQKAQVYDEALERVQFFLTILDDFQREKPNDLAAFLEEISIVRPEDKDVSDTVKLMTLHSSKGLEFNTVFIVGAAERGFPLPPKDGQDNSEEERRLMYVGMTRARERLYVSYPEFMAVPGGESFNAAPSPFFDEMLPENRSYVQWEPDEAPLRSAAPALNWSRKSAPKKRDDDAIRYDLPYSGFEEPSIQIDNFVVRNQRVSDGAIHRLASQTADISATSKNGRTINVGSVVKHAVHGQGIVRELSGSGRDIKAIVDFKTAGRRTIVARFLEI